MKITINKSAKRVLSIALALAMLAGTLFTANVGVNITADAETAPIAEGTIDLLESGSDAVLADNGETGADWDNAIIIDSAEELVYLCKEAGDATIGKYYKVADGLAGFNLSAAALDLDGTLADNLTTITGSGKNQANSTVYFQGNFDGNGAVVYGAYSTGGSYAGLFGVVKGEVTIKNLGVALSYFKATTAAGGIVGYHKADAMCTVTIENCFVKDCYIESTGQGWGTAVGGVMGWANSAPSYTGTEDADKDGKLDTVYVNVAYNVDNCFVELDETYFISKGEGNAASSDIRTCHGGVVGGAGSNAVTVSNCVVIGVTPYSTSICSSANDVQHTGGASHFKNIYTDQATGSIQINYNTGWAHYIQDFSAYVFQLTPVQMQGIAAVANMNLEWFSTWAPGADGEYPTLVKPGEEQGISFWTGSAATEFADGTGTKDDPFIIETADQLYYALSNTTDPQVTVSYSFDTKDSDDDGDTEEVLESKADIAGGKKTSEIKHQEYEDTTSAGYQKMMPVFTPYYYKIADGVKSFYFNSIYGNETLDGIKDLVANGTNKKDWKPGKSFVGNLDGNGVTIYGMYSSTGTGLIQKLDGSATVKNFNFDSCYSSSSGNAALLTTNLGSYVNDSTIINVANISVRNSYIATSRDITLSQRTDNKLYQYSPGSAGIVSTQSTAENFTMSNCLYDGHTCERAIGSGSEVTVDMIGAIISGGNGMNNVVLNSCVSLGAPAVDEVYVSGKEMFYNRYDKNQGFPVHFYGCYSDMPLNAITTAYPDKYDKLKDIERVTESDAYEMFDMPKLAWGNWALTETEDGRIIPMPTVNNSAEVVGSYVSIIGSEAKNGKYASVGPYPGGTNPYTYTLKGSGTEADPFIIETDVQLARAIATGGMNLYDKLYYKLGNDIDLSGGAWINQDSISTTTSAYTYTPFSGTLDGDGHTITGLSAGDSASAGLIPVLDGGTVKNLHIRNASVVSGEYAGVIVGKMITGNIISCSVENFDVSSKMPTKNIVGYDTDVEIFYYWDPTDEWYDTEEFGEIYNVYAINGDDYFYRPVIDADDGILCHYGTGTLVNEYDYDISKWLDIIDTSVWYIGGAEGSLPRLVNHAAAMEEIDIVGDGKTDDYGSADLTALRNMLLRKSAYANIYGDVSRNGTVNIADLAVLQRIITDRDGWVDITDSFFANVKAGNIKVYYGENDNYDAARKVELYLEAQTGADVDKVVVDDTVVWGSNSDATATYVHQNDFCLLDGNLYYPIGDDYSEITNSDEKAKYALDGELEIIVGNIDNYSAYATNTVATADNTYAVTYDADKKVVWLQGANFTAVEQAAINFANGCNVQGDKVYTCASTELKDYKKPVTVKLDTNYDGTIDTNKTFYYAWGDEFEGDTIDTNYWTHNNQQTEGTQGSENSSFNNLEMAPIKDLGKVIVVENGRLSMKRGHDSELGGDVSYTTSEGKTIVGSVSLDVTPGEENGYTQWTNGANGENSIDADGSDQYLTSGKIITDRGMLFKQGYVEFQGQLPADGHAFPAWWLMGRPAQAANNNGYDNSLYSKVYKLNGNWDGSPTWNQTNLDTYKYQIPSAIYEIDMIEVMQHSDRHQQIKDAGWLSRGSYYNDDYKSRRTAVNLYFLNSTIHKWWNNGVYNNGTDDTSDDKLYIHDWDNYKVLGGITNDAFSTTSTAGSWIHNIGSTIYDFGTATREKYPSDYWDTREFQQTPHDKLTATRRYGFSWNTDGVSKFEATLYIYNTDGSLLTTVPIASGMSDYAAFKDGDKETEANGAIGANAGVYSDAKVFNQYMYFLFDNKYYSSNDNIASTTSNMFTDLLTCAGLKSLEIDYVRVYQEDGARDIVTKETEAFNNNNHFGY